MQYDVFISHASVDKEVVARPLAEALQVRGVAVWLDEEQLQIGDSIRRGIDQALSQSRFGAVILSPAYLESEWTRKELDALFTKEKYQNKTILPISHKVSRETIEGFSPMLADKITLSTDDDIEVLADRIQVSVQALPKTQQVSVSKGWRTKFLKVNWHWLLATVTVLAAITIPAWLNLPNAPSDNQKPVTINVNKNNGSISADTIRGDKIVNQTIINQAPNTEELAEQLFARMGRATVEDLQIKNEEIKRLTETITRLQQHPGNEYKQSALKKLEQDKPQEAAELLKQSLAERDKARQVEAKQMAEDWVDIGNIAYLNNTQEALTAYQKATQLDSDSIRAWSGLGKTHHKLGNYGDSLKAYSQVKKRASNDSLAWQLPSLFVKATMDKTTLKSLAKGQSLVGKTQLLVAEGHPDSDFQLHALNEAENSFLSALLAYEIIDDLSGIAEQNRNIGLVYKQRNTPDIACRYWKTSLLFSRKAESLSKPGIGELQQLIMENCPAGA